MVGGTTKADPVDADCRGCDGGGSCLATPPRRSDRVLCLRNDQPLPRYPAGLVFGGDSKPRPARILPVLSPGSGTIPHLRLSHGRRRCPQDECQRFPACMLCGLERDQEPADWGPRRISHLAGRWNTLRLVDSRLAPAVLRRRFRRSRNWGREGTRLPEFAARRTHGDSIRRTARRIHDHADRHRCMGAVRRHSGPAPRSVCRVFRTVVRLFPDWDDPELLSQAHTRKLSIRLCRESKLPGLQLDRAGHLSTRRPSNVLPAVRGHGQQSDRGSHRRLQVRRTISTAPTGPDRGRHPAGTAEAAGAAAAASNPSWAAVLYGRGTCHVCEDDRLVSGSSGACIDRRFL